MILINAMTEICDPKCRGSTPDRWRLGEEESMAAVMHRVAVATIATPDQLLEALTDLKAVPIAIDDLCCLGTRDRLAKAADILERATGHPDLVTVVRDVAPLGIAQATPEIVATANRWLTRIKSSESDLAAGPAGPVCWLTHRNRAALVEQLTKGDVGLVVNAPNSQLWTSSTQALLRHSSSPVHGLMRPWSAI